MIGKPRGKKGLRPVLVYDPALRRKVYVGAAATLREARLLEAEKTVEIQQRAGRRGKDWTVAGWAQHWLAHHHGENTSRPEPTTYQHNEQATRAFIATYGGRKISTLTRDEALAWSRTRPNTAKVIAAMLNDARKSGHLTTNPFAELGLNRGKGRAEIEPLSMDEIEKLADIARRTHGLYGDEFGRLITFAGWTGLRPGEVCALEWTEVDLRTMEVRVWWQRRNNGQRARTKTKENRTVVLAQAAAEALSGLPRRPGAVFRSRTGKELRPNSLRHEWISVRNTFAAGLPADHWLPRRLRQNPKDHLDPYELRHACGSYLASQGLTVEEIASHLGNTPEVCRTYVHLHRDLTRDRIRQAFGSNVRTIGTVTNGDQQAHG